MDEFSTNRHSGKPQDAVQLDLIPHLDLCFEDGSLAVLTGRYYFLVHEGLLRRHSQVLDDLIKTIDRSKLLNGRPILVLEGCPQDMANFLQALYDGIPTASSDASDWSKMSGLLRLLTKFKVQRLRSDLLRGVMDIWPSKLSKWESRERHFAPAVTQYNRERKPHPICMINLAREIDAPELLPSAFYDLSRSPPCHAVIGSSGSVNHSQELSDVDLLSLLRGREHASRFLSTFIVNELEGREPSEWCKYRDDEEPGNRRTCQIAFEAITFGLLRDVNGATSDRASDPLQAIIKAEVMQTGNGSENKAARRTCEACRSEFGVVVGMAKEEFWQKLPHWFGVRLESWA